MAIPTLEEVRNRLSVPEGRISDEELTDTLAAEVQLQALVCRVPVDPTEPPADVFPVALKQAIFRRVARALAMKGLPIAVLRGDAETGSTILPSNDPEVRRLERPFRIEVVA